VYVCSKYLTTAVGTDDVVVCGSIMGQWQCILDGVHALDNDISYVVCRIGVSLEDACVCVGW
jgi:hypothetical protein